MHCIKNRTPTLHDQPDLNFLKERAVFAWHQENSNEVLGKIASV